MSKTPARPRKRRRFRRRLLAVLLLCGLAPLIAWGALASRAAAQALSLSLEPLEPLLERAQAAAHRLEPGPGQGSVRDPELEADLRAARLHLGQVELARRSLGRLLPLLLLGAALLSAGLLTAAAALLGRALSRPLELLAQGMARVGQGDLSQPLAERPGRDDDELELLVRAFNRMAAELRVQRERLRASENLAAWQDVAQRLAHELKNPLTAMKLALARAQRATDPVEPAVGGDQVAGAPDRAERLREATGLLAEEVEVLLRMTASFAQFARLPAPELRDLDLGLLVREAAGLYAAAGPVPVQCAAGDCPVRGDPDQLRRLLGHLIKNGLEASRAGGPPVEVALAIEGGRARVEIRDGGAGLAAPIEGMELLRSRGSTTPPGSGLGLPIAQKIAHDHGGGLRLEPRPGGGAVARVDLPVRPGAATATTAGQEAA